MKRHKYLLNITTGILIGALVFIAAAVILAFTVPKVEIIRDMLLGLGTGFLTSGIVSAFFAIADHCDTKQAINVFNANIDYIVGLTVWFVNQTNQVFNNVNQYAMPGGTIVNNYITNIKIENDVTIENQTIMNLLTDHASPSEYGHEHNGGHNDTRMMKIEAVQSEIMECFLRVSERAFNRVERALEKCSDFIAKADNSRIKFLEQYRRIKDLGQGFLHPEARSGSLMHAARNFLENMGKAELERTLPFGDAKAYAEKWGELFPASAPWIAEQDFISFPLSSARVSLER